MTSVQSEAAVPAGNERMLIDGELQYTVSGAKSDVIHPASEDVPGQVTDGSVADMERAVRAARRAFDGRRDGEEGFKEYLESKTVGMPA